MAGGEVFNAEVGQFTKSIHIKTQLDHASISICDDHHIFNLVFAVEYTHTMKPMGFERTVDA